MTPRLYTRLAARARRSRGALYVAVVVLIALALHDPAGARYFTSVAMLMWGLAVATYVFRPARREAAPGVGAERRLTPWLLALALNGWLLLAIYLLFI